MAQGMAPGMQANLSAVDQAAIKEITDFWFTDPSQPGWDRHSKPGGWIKKWFVSTPEQDKMMKDKWGRHY